MTDLHFDKDNGEIDTLISQLVEKAGAHHPTQMREMMLTALKAGQEGKTLADLQMITMALKEMRYTSKVFEPYRDRKKVTIFGSARTNKEEDIYQQCATFARNLAENGFMVITGGGGGIMQAGNEGAGVDNSFAASIRLPFECSVNPTMAGSRHHITYKYFFTRKVCMVKQADAIALFPGGFGTLDEATEILTLIQTGKTKPIPLILFETEQKDFWAPWVTFTKHTLLRKKLISEGDLSLFTVVSTPEEGLETIQHFYRNYHSCRYVGDRLVIQINYPLDSNALEILNDRFAHIVKNGERITQFAADAKDYADPDNPSSPRIVFTFNKKDFGHLQSLIWNLNDLHCTDSLH